MKTLFILAALFLVGCSAPGSRFIYSNPDGSNVIVEMEKEVIASDLKVNIDALKGVATISASKWESRSEAVIREQAKRESLVTESLSKGAARGAVEGLKSSGGMPSFPSGVFNIPGPNNLITPN